MVLLNTNIFVIDRFFRRDHHYSENQLLVEMLPDIEAGFYIFSLFELCGISSFNLSPAELDRWMFEFSDEYDIAMLPPIELHRESATEWFRRFRRSIFSITARKITFGDALIVQAAENYAVEAILT